VIGADEQAITIILFMRKEVREQWHRSSKGTGHYRSQQHAPPADLPPLTISIFSDGSALPRKIGQPAPPAGYGVVAVEGASLDAINHARGCALFYMCGRVPPGAWRRLASRPPPIISPNSWHSLVGSSGPTATQLHKYPP
jgi:hypothetical protein